MAPYAYVNEDHHIGWLIANSFVTGRIMGGDVSPTVDDDERFINAYADYYAKCRALGNSPKPMATVYRFYRTMVESISDDSLPLSLTECEKVS